MSEALIPPPQMISRFEPHPPTPLEIPVKLHVFLFKFWLLRSLPPRFSNDHPWGGYGYFMDLHNKDCLIHRLFQGQARADFGVRWEIGSKRGVQGGGLEASTECKRWVMGRKNRTPSCLSPRPPLSSIIN